MLFNFNKKNKNIDYTDIFYQSYTDNKLKDVYFLFFFEGLVAYLLVEELLYH